VQAKSTNQAIWSWTRKRVAQSWQGARQDSTTGACVEAEL
jgi:hypothetical protein